MDRRQLIRLGFAGAATGIIAPKLALARSCDNMAGGLYYTEQVPGRWSKKASGHLPNIEASKNSNGVVLHIVTAHGMSGYEHYIVKHVVLDKNFNFIAEKMFDPTIDKIPVSDISIGQYKGAVNVLSVCNKHDSWLNTVEV
jgi:superoxide reductase